jgi:hypothetical protein
VGQLRAAWPQVRITLRADSDFAREELMKWCEQHEVDYIFGLARNSRLEAAISGELAEAEVQFYEYFVKTTGLTKWAAAKRLFQLLSDNPRFGTRSAFKILNDGWSCRGARRLK